MEVPRPRGPLAVSVVRVAVLVVKVVSNMAAHLVAITVLTPPAPSFLEVLSPLAVDLWVAPSQLVTLVAMAVALAAALVVALGALEKDTLLLRTSLAQAMAPPKFPLVCLPAFLPAMTLPLPVLPAIPIPQLVTPVSTFPARALLVVPAGLMMRNFPVFTPARSAHSRLRCRRVNTPL